MNKIKILLILAIKRVCYTLANVIPKNNKIWIFGAWYGHKYSDNPKAFFEYINKHHDKKTKAVWITKDKDIIKTIQDNNYLVYHESSVLGIWYQFRASKAIVCQSLHDDLFSPAVGLKTQVIQLWHGIPLKKIMYDAFPENKEKKNLFGRIADDLSPYNEHRNDIVVSTSELTKKLLGQAFRVKPEQVLTCGFPRNDVFFEEVSTATSPHLKCIYMPTFRGGAASECDLFERYGFNFDKIESQLKEHNIELTLRMHPVNKPPAKIVEQIKNSSVIKLDAGGDIYETLNQYDCLITDYSSVYIDFLLSNKPIIFAPFDLDEYKQRERSLYFEFEEATLQPYSYSWENILDRLITLITNGTTEEYNNKYTELKNKYHEEPSLSPSPFSTQLYRELTSNK